MNYRTLLLTLITATVLTACENTKPQPTPPEPKSKWISQIVAYTPAPGQFINTGQGNPEAAKSIIGKRGTVSLGSFGGSITFCFDHRVKNIDGADFVILGNAFEGGSEPGGVCVAVDRNENGKPDADEWYELLGSQYDKTAKNYTIIYERPAQTDVAGDIAWTDNLARQGVLTVNEFHKQCYFPLFTGQGKQLTLSGNKPPYTPYLKDGIWVMSAFDGGYADNYSADYPAAVGGDPDTAGSNKFDISQAVNAGGEVVVLDHVDFIKVYTCVYAQAGVVGEISTEVCGAISLGM